MRNARCLRNRVGFTLFASWRVLRGCPENRSVIGYVGTPDDHAAPGFDPRVGLKSATAGSIDSDVEFSLVSIPTEENLGCQRAREARGPGDTVGRGGHQVTDARGRRSLRASNPGSAGPGSPGYHALHLGERGSNHKNSQKKQPGCGLHQHELFCSGQLEELQRIDHRNNRRPRKLKHPNPHLSQAFAPSSSPPMPGGPLRSVPA